jgi:hypothetical protein
MRMYNKFRILIKGTLHNHLFVHGGSGDCDRTIVRGHTTIQTTRPRILNTKHSNFIRPLLIKENVYIAIIFVLCQVARRHVVKVSIRQRTPRRVVVTQSPGCSLRKLAYSIATKISVIS